MPRQARTMTQDERGGWLVFAVCAVVIGLPLYFAFSFIAALAIHLGLVVWYYGYLRFVGGTMLEMVVLFFILALLITIFVPSFQRARQKARHEAQQHHASRPPVTQAEASVV